MLTIINYADAESLASKGDEEFRIEVEPNIFNKFQLYLTGEISKGVEIIGNGPMAMRAYYSLLDYSQLVGIALRTGYRIYIKKEGKIFKEGDWFIEFRL